MPTATIGSPQTIALGASDALIVSCSAVDAVASVAGSTGFIGAPYELGRVVGETGRRFGPYGRSVSVIVSALAGSIAAEVSQPSRVGDGADAMSTQQGAAGQALVSKDGTTGVWRNLPASGVIMRVRMTGTGTVSMDSATGDLGAGTVTTAAYIASVAGTQIDDYAYPGDAARSIRFTLTGTAAVEVY